MIKGLSPTCDTWVALGADPWTPGEHLLRDIANSERSSNTILFNVNRDRDQTTARTFEPIPGPTLVQTPEQEAVAEERRLEERQRQALAEQSSVITHDIGQQLFSGQVTMLEMSQRIHAAGGVS